MALMVCASVCIDTNENLHPMICIWKWPWIRFGWLYYLNPDLDSRHSMHAHICRKMETQKFSMMHFYDLFFMKIYTLKPKKRMYGSRQAFLTENHHQHPLVRMENKMKNLEMLSVQGVSVRVALIRADNYRRNGHKAILAFQSIKCCWTEFSGIIESKSNVHTYTQPNQTKPNGMTQTMSKWKTRTQKITTRIQRQLIGIKILNWKCDGSDAKGDTDTHDDIISIRNWTIPSAVVVAVRLL